MPGMQPGICERYECGTNGFGSLPAARSVGLGTLDDIRSSFVEVRALLESADHIIAEYIQVQKMASVENLARELGHDLRNGLMALAGKIFQLEQEAPHEEVRKKAEDIRGILRSLEEMISRLQFLGTDEQSEDDFVLYDLGIETNRVVKLICSSMGEGVQLCLEPAPDPLPVMLCKGDVWRILSNLLLNARDAMPEGGRLQVRVADRHVDAAYCQKHGNASRGHFAVLTVKDEGTGIPPDTLPRIFDPLFSTKSASQDGQKRGWGLTIVYTLVRRRGGWIDVASRPERGARFEVFVPVYHPA